MCKDLSIMVLSVLGRGFRSKNLYHIRNAIAIFDLVRFYINIVGLRDIMSTFIIFGFTDVS